ncbi:hypothetical protein EHS13_30120 [Paenibacillus psychroresistens]|uniref:Uncharacterized protein n=1 Tax=Paenibacillus psychroresistens TaxID=1778678 RepID=A0A6B8RSP2_9BACL|nr:hypothetical protein [Paenibacillus psychroresistens]QGQ98834.1 hypothetical protein EHS13_30120 [Paenibacillus psychroresistens]
MLSNHEQVQKSMSIIVKEIQTLCLDLQQLRVIYDEAADECDLTFIKILKDKYELLEDEFLKLSGVVTDVQVGLVNSAKESPLIRKIV